MADRCRPTRPNRNRPSRRASMADHRQAKEVLTVLLLCVAWYAISSSNNVIGKMLLNEFPYPMTMTMIQLLSITVYSGPLFNMWGIRKYVDMSWRYYFRLIVPLAFGKFFASVFSHVSIWKVPVSYAHTGKRSEYRLCQTSKPARCPQSRRRCHFSL